MAKRYLDTYALVEIAEGNKAFFQYTEDEIVLCDLTLVELYGVLLRKHGVDLAERWYRALELHSVPAEHTILKKAHQFRTKHPRKFSQADAAGYAYANYFEVPFVTGDKEFKGLPNVEFKAA